MKLLTILTALALAPTAQQTPVGNWKMTIQVGHIGEGLRTVILEIEEDGDGYHGALTSMQNRMTDADEVTFEDDVLTVWYGSYEYKLTIDGDRAEGTVTSPTGTQDVHAARQDSQLFAGDEPEPYQKTWRGTIEKQDGSYVIRTRRNVFSFVNASDFASELAGFDGKTVSILGYWRVDTIEIQAIEPWEGRR